MAERTSEKPPTAIPSVLFVGANGFLGRNMVPLFAQRHPECKIHLLDIAPTTSLKYPYHSGDITDPAALLDIFQKIKPAVVIHSASPPIPTVGKGDENLFFRVNVEGTRNIIRACNEAGVRALVYTSSASVIYNGGNLVNANEQTPYASRHVDPYNASKVRTLGNACSSLRLKPTN
jgi:sterol-4alpha-carboxylate 3-dehydrogenase (decarboxylating)